MRVSSLSFTTARQADIKHSMRFLLVPDFYLLRGFQAIADFLARWIGCYRLAIAVLTLAQVLSALDAVVSDSFILRMLNGLACGSFLFSNGMRVRALWRMLERFNFLPAWFYFDFPLRTVFVLMVLFSLLLDLLPPVTLYDRTNVLFWFVEASGYYFSACRQIRPPAKTVKRESVAFQGAA